MLRLFHFVFCDNFYVDPMHDYWIVPPALPTSSCEIASIVNYFSIPALAATPFWK